ncbi:hypothetical protein UFOVP1247_14 [uncultured Caudovirales phage]|uniref:Uncharacterized protein n=1 Tax=uncultured Caudovirales phage TaxID=2100421 RepID=A0A6J5RFQ1_9CAUD|nr:hypothetical protein UFOVP970_54 [uncultured Caudovirales phage]CAB4193067.1 hypothetical protein UFOVP1247_14 [uncultured Caudovirales phage]
MRSNQEEINQRISKSLKGRGNSPIKKNCPSCKNEFEVSWSKRHQLSCSRKCSMTNRNLGSTRNETYRNNISHGLKQLYASGKKVYGGRTKWYEYGAYKVQGTYELRTCKILDKWKKEGLIKDWEYTNDRISYSYDGRQSTYLLDFKIYRFDETYYYLETKGYATDKDIFKWSETRKQGHELIIWFGSNITENE